MVDCNYLVYSGAEGEGVNFDKEVREELEYDCGYLSIMERNSKSVFDETYTWMWHSKRVYGVSEDAAHSFCGFYC